MSQYESLLLAYGTPPAEARLLAWGQDIQQLRNREHEAYGRSYEIAETLDGRYASTDSHWSSK